MRRWGCGALVLGLWACSSTPQGGDGGLDASGPADLGPSRDAAPDGGTDATPVDASPDAEVTDGPADRDADSPDGATPLDAEAVDGAPRDAEPTDAEPTDAEAPDAGPTVDECLGQPFPLVDGARWIWAVTATTAAVTSTATEVLLLSGRGPSTVRADYLVFKANQQLSTYGYTVECRPDGILVHPDAITLTQPPFGQVRIEFTSATGLTLPKIFTPGQSWQATYGVQAMGFSSALTIQYRAGAPEVVAIPGGSVTAHPISATFTLNLPLGPQSVTLVQASTLWLSSTHGVVRLGPDQLTRTFGTSQVTTSESRLLEVTLP